MKGRAKSLPVIRRKSRRKKVWFVAYVRNPTQCSRVNLGSQQITVKLALQTRENNPKNSGENRGCFRARWETLSGTREIHPKRAPKSLRAREVFGSFEKRTPGVYLENEAQCNSRLCTSSFDYNYQNSFQTFFIVSSLKWDLNNLMTRILVVVAKWRIMQITYMYREVMTLGTHWFQNLFFYVSLICIYILLISAFKLTGKLMAKLLCKPNLTCILKWMYRLSTS